MSVHLKLEAVDGDDIQWKRKPRCQFNRGEKLLSL